MKYRLLINMPTRMNITAFKIVPLNLLLRLTLHHLMKEQSYHVFQTKFQNYSIYCMFTREQKKALEYECNLYKDPTVSCL